MIMLLFGYRSLRYILVNYFPLTNHTAINIGVKQGAIFYVKFT